MSGFLKRIGQGGAVMALCLGMAGAAARAETLGQTLADAYRNSNLLEQNRAVLRATDEDAAGALAALRPTLALVQDFTWQMSDAAANPLAIDSSATLSLVADLTLLDGGQRGLKLEAAREAVLATRESLVGVEQTVLLGAVRAYMEVRGRTAILDLRRSDVELSREEVRAARDRFEVGEVTRTDVALAESRLALAQSQLAGAEGELLAARETYRAAVGRLPSGPLAAPPPLPRTAASVDEARALAQRGHPSIRQAQRNVTARELAVQIAEASLGPTVGATLSSGINDQSQQTNSLRLRLSQPVYSGGAIPSAVRKSMAQRDQARAALHETTLGIVQQVGSAWARARAAEATIAAAREQIRAATIAFEGTREEAQLGARTTLDVLDAQQELLNANANLIEAEATLNTRIYEVLAAMGLMTADHLGLDVPRYDPALYFDAVRAAPSSTSAQGRKLDELLSRIGRD